MLDRVEITIVCEKLGKHELRALFFDPVTQQFYGGSGGTALEALAWCMDEYVGRAVLGFPVMAARNSNATPGSRFSNPTPITTFSSPTPQAQPVAARSRKRGKKAA